MVGFLRRNVKVDSRQIKEQTYKARIQPVLEYASTVWDPPSQKDVTKLEAVQRRAARFVLNRHHQTSSVNQMLNILKWPSLQQRRRHARLTILYKILYREVNVSFSDKIHPLTERSRRSHSQQLKKITCRTQYRQVSFLPHTISDWNLSSAPGHHRCPHH